MRANIKRSDDDPVAKSCIWYMPYYNDQQYWGNCDYHHRGSRVNSTFYRETLPPGRRCW
jgi:hypothetical protein